MTYQQAGVDSNDARRTHRLLPAKMCLLIRRNDGNLSPYLSRASMILRKYCEQDWLCINCLVGGLFIQ